MSRSTTSSGVAALVLLAALYGLTGVLARYLGDGLGVFEQWYLRYGLGCMFAVLLFRKQIRYRQFLRIDKREWAVLLFRTIIGSVIGIALYTLAVQKAKLGPITFMQAVPTMALFGVFLLHEKITRNQILLVGLSFLGAATVAVNNVHDLTALNTGALLSLISGALFSLVLVTRRWHSDMLNNHELTFALTGLGAICTYLVSLATYHRAFIPAHVWDWQFSAVLLIAGMFSTSIFFLFNYGFEHVSAVVGSTLMDLEVLFGILFGYIFYRETLGSREVIGGLIILLAVVAMNYVSNHDDKIVNVVPIPD